MREVGNVLGIELVFERRYSVSVLFWLGVDGGFRSLVYSERVRGWGVLGMVHWRLTDN